MKKHILSKYSERNNHYTENIFGKTTYETSTVESSDPDEFLLNSTMLTESIETSDSDEFVLGPTVLTENVELSDPDEFCCSGPTNATFTVENSDEDEFVLNNASIGMQGDFDEVLFL